MGRRVVTRFGGAALAVIAIAAGPISAQTVAVDADPRPRDQRVRLVGATPPAPGPDGRVSYPIGRTGTTVRIDGLLDDDAWGESVVIPLPYEVAPADNGAAQVATECRLVHDDEHLYLGCVAQDANPDGIRAFIVDRDGIESHDRIVLTLDPFDDQRRAFQFGVSALGVQSDAVLAQQGTGDPNQGGNAGAPDLSWDAIWASAGSITGDGYVVEAAIPFRSLRFPTTDGAMSWGAYISRWWPRSSNVETRSVTLDRSDACALCQAHAITGIQGVRPGANIQLTPTLTGSRVTDRANGRASPLEARPADGDFGMDAQWGVTSDLTLNLTANPDFSQVEADVAQLDVNNRFALFFPEKRLFFLEGADFFGTPIQAVFTRSIADPVAGGKVTGKLGDNAVGALVARDRSAGLLIPGTQSSANATLDGEVTTAIGRFRRDLGTSSTVGALVTSREGAGYRNRVGGLDAFYRPLSSITLQGQFLGSSTRYPDAVVDQNAQRAGTFRGSAARFRGQWQTRDWSIFANASNLGPDFRADAGFLTQTGIDDLSSNVARRFWGGSDRWFTQIRLEAGTWRIRDTSATTLLGGIWFGVNYEGPWQSRVSFWPNLLISEHFAGVSHDGLSQYYFESSISPSGTLTAGLNGDVGDVVDYANARLGHQVRLSPFAELRLGRNLQATLRHTVQRLQREGNSVFTAHLAEVRTVYNFSPRSYLRTIVQYRRTDRDPALYTATVDRRSTGVLAQVLYAYKVNPQTVFFLGYGEDGDGSIDDENRRSAFATRARTFFLKLGYAWRP